MVAPGNTVETLNLSARSKAVGSAVHYVFSAVAELLSQDPFGESGRDQPSLETLNLRAASQVASQNGLGRTCWSRNRRNEMSYAPRRAPAPLQAQPMQMASAGTSGQFTKPLVPFSPLRQR